MSEKRWELAERVDLVWNHVERFGTVIGWVVLLAAGPTGHAIGQPNAMTGLYYVIPMAALGLFFLIVGQRRKNALRPSLTSTVRREYTKERIRLVDLVEPDNVIRNVNFTECVVEGPAVICGSGGYLSIYEAEMIAHNPMSGFIVLPENAPRPDGAIGLQNCILTKCRFHNVAIASTLANVNQSRAAFGLPPIVIEPPRPLTQST